MTKGKLICFEGIDNCGKTTQIAKTLDYMKSLDFKVTSGREPGTTALGGALRRIIKEPERVYSLFNHAFEDNEDFQELDITQKRSYAAEILLFMAPRAEYFAHVVEPIIEQGAYFISDRCRHSTRAYQGGGRYKSNPEIINFINNVNDFVTKGIYPDITFFLDISPQTMVERSGGKRDYMESSNLEFWHATRAEYLKIAEEDGNKFITIDGTKERDTIFNEDIKPNLTKLLKIQHYGI
jgi:dTMP kinase